MNAILTLKKEDRFIMKEADKEAREVYMFIWKTLKEAAALLTTKQMSLALHHGSDSVMLSIKLLREAGLLEE
jgi:hypothetical protein